MYIPSTQIPADPQQLAIYLRSELQKISEAMRPSVVQLAELPAPPKKLKEGLLAIADGVNWNPGSGRGLYRYGAGTWNFLG